jgi:lipoate-protein ligase A
VLHHLELTYAFAAPLGRGPFGFDLQAAYRAICGALVEGLDRLGVRAQLSAASEDPMVRPTEAIPCFVGPASGEVITGGRKLVGSAMRRIGDAILQHGAILEGWDGALQAGCLGLPDDALLRPAVVTLADLFGVAPAPTAHAAAIGEGFRAAFGIELEESALTAAERARAGLLARERYGHRRWTVDRNAALG